MSVPTYTGTDRPIQVGDSVVNTISDWQLTGGVTALYELKQGAVQDTDHPTWIAKVNFDLGGNRWIDACDLAPITTDTVLVPIDADLLARFLTTDTRQLEVEVDGLWISHGQHLEEYEPGTDPYLQAEQAFQEKLVENCTIETVQTLIHDWMNDRTHFAPHPTASAIVNQWTEDTTNGN